MINLSVVCVKSKSYKKIYVTKFAVKKITACRVAFFLNEAFREIYFLKI